MHFIVIQSGKLFNEIAINLVSILYGQPCGFFMGKVEDRDDVQKLPDSNTGLYSVV